ncbi:hypothetical protein FOCC_FOCC005595 [Frankliniella occidentalis]|nr:hypothetical protein FOCC_FOCC005595 [Frankliniella occidentalis]
MQANNSAKSVLLVISVAGIKVCSPDGQGVLMAHALRRISYATCEPLHAQFSFLAREPRGQLSLQYCHSFLAASPQQVSFPYYSHRRVYKVEYQIATIVSMGRISGPVSSAGVGGQLTTDTLRALFRAHYQKLVNDYPYPEYKDKDNSPRFVAPADQQQQPPLPPAKTPAATTVDAVTYNCKHCGQSDKLQVNPQGAFVIGEEVSTRGGARPRRAGQEVMHPGDAFNDRVAVWQGSAERQKAALLAECNVRFVPGCPGRLLVCACMCVCVCVGGICRNRKAVVTLPGGERC